MVVSRIFTPEAAPAGTLTAVRAVVVGSLAMDIVMPYGVINNTLGLRDDGS